MVLNNKSFKQLIDNEMKNFRLMISTTFAVITLVFTMVLICAIDGTDKEVLYDCFIIDVIMIYICFRYISYKELMELKIVRFFIGK